MKGHLHKEILGPRISKTSISGQLFQICQSHTVYISETRSTAVAYLVQSTLLDLLAEVVLFFTVGPCQLIDMNSTNSVIRHWLLLGVGTSSKALLDPWADSISNSVSYCAVKPFTRWQHQYVRVYQIDPVYTYDATPQYIIRSFISFSMMTVSTCKKRKLSDSFAAPAPAAHATSAT